MPLVYLKGADCPTMGKRCLPTMGKRFGQALLALVHKMSISERLAQPEGHVVPSLAERKVYSDRLRYNRRLHADAEAEVGLKMEGRFDIGDRARERPAGRAGRAAGRLGRGRRRTPTWCWANADR